MRRARTWRSPAVDLTVAETRAPGRAPTEGSEVCLGVIVGPHGIRGLVRIKSFASKPADLSAYGPLRSEDGTRTFDVTVVGLAKGTVLAEIAGVRDRDDAEALGGTRLYVARSALPPTDPDEYYHADLIGIMAEREDGTAFGRVVALYDHGAGDIVEIEPESGPTVLLPFTREIVPVVDPAARRIVVADTAGASDEAASDEPASDEEDV